MRINETAVLLFFFIFLESPLSFDRDPGGIYVSPLKTKKPSQFNISPVQNRKIRTARALILGWFGPNIFLLTPRSF